jgi:hypothetical protein
MPALALGSPLLDVVLRRKIMHAAACLHAQVGALTFERIILAGFWRARERHGRMLDRNLWSSVRRRGRAREKVDE